MPSAALGDGSDSGDGCVAPFSTSHFFWSCLIDGPNLDTPVSVDTLIDNGSHLVLIDATLIKKLGLPISTLSKPLNISVAMSSCNREALSQYVQLSC